MALRKHIEQQYANDYFSHSPSPVDHPRGDERFSMMQDDVRCSGGDHHFKDVMWGRVCRGNA